jgi:hypothetical protein
VINDPGVVATAEKVLKAAFGDKFRPSPPVTPSTRGRTRGKNKRLRCLITSPALLVSADEVIELDAIAAMHEAGSDTNAKCRDVRDTSAAE